MTEASEGKKHKKFWWFKLQKNYFNKLEQKKMKRQPNGRDIQVIYLQMILYSIDKGGNIFYQGVFDSLEEELSEEFGEPVEKIIETIEYLKEESIIVLDEEKTCYIPEAVENTGSETASTQRVRKHRLKKKALQCNTSETNGNANETNGNAEKETDTETDLNLKSDKSKTLDFKSKTETETDTDQADADLDSVDRQAVSATANADPPTGDLFSVDQLKRKSKSVNLTPEGFEVFHRQMQEDGWKLYGEPVEKEYILRTLREWAKKHEEYHRDQEEDDDEAIVDEIYKIVKGHIGEEQYKKNLMERKEGIKNQVCLYCNRDLFTKRQLNFMEETWGLIPAGQ